MPKKSKKKRDKTYIDIKEKLPTSISIEGKIHGIFPIQKSKSYFLLVPSEEIYKLTKKIKDSQKEYSLKDWLEKGKEFSGMLSGLEISLGSEVIGKIESAHVMIPNELERKIAYGKGSECEYFRSSFLELHKEEGNSNIVLLDQWYELVKDGDKILQKVYQKGKEIGTIEIIHTNNKKDIIKAIEDTSINKHLMVKNYKLFYPFFDEQTRNKGLNHISIEVLNKDGTLGMSKYRRNNLAPPQHNPPYDKVNLFHIIGERTKTSVTCHLKYAGLENFLIHIFNTGFDLEHEKGNKPLIPLEIKAEPGVFDTYKNKINSYLEQEKNSEEQKQKEVKLIMSEKAEGKPERSEEIPKYFASIGWALYYNFGKEPDTRALIEKGPALELEYNKEYELVALVDEPSNPDKVKCGIDWCVITEQAPVYHPENNKDVVKGISLHPKAAVLHLQSEKLIQVSYEEIHKVIYQDIGHFDPKEKVDLVKAFMGKMLL